MILTAYRWPPGSALLAAPEEVQIEVEIRPGYNDEPYLFITRGGPTGYESMPITKWNGRDWTACAGCANYAMLRVPAAEMRRVVEASGLSESTPRTTALAQLAADAKSRWPQQDKTTEI